MKRLLVAIAAVCELAAAAGLEASGFGSIHVSLIAAGLFFYFVSELI